MDGFHHVVLFCLGAIPVIRENLAAKFTAKTLAQPTGFQLTKTPAPLPKRDESATGNNSATGNKNSKSNVASKTDSSPATNGSNSGANPHYLALLLGLVMVYASSLI
jgi:hypothetical protein